MYTYIYIYIYIFLFVPPAPPAGSPLQPSRAGSQAAVGTQNVVPTPDFRIFPGGKNHRKTQDNEK